MSILGDLWSVVSGVIDYVGSEEDEETAQRATSAARYEETRRYTQQYKDWQRQARIENMTTQEELRLSRDTFNWGRAKWNQEFNLTKQDWLAKRQQLALENRRTGLDRMMGGLMNSWGLRTATSDDVLKRLGA